MIQYAYLSRMKIFRWVFKVFFTLLILLILSWIGLSLSGNLHLLKAIKSTYLVGETGPTILDYPKFVNREIKTGTPSPWRMNLSTKKPAEEFMEEAEAWETQALLVVQNNQIIYENYWGKLDQESLSNSFSMAKSFVSIGLGVAVKKGYIKNLNQPVYEFIPEFNSPEKRKVRIVDLLKMSSGIDFGESYGDPFGFMAKAYYGKELYELTVEKPQKVPPGKEWKYQGGNTLLLSFILQKATGKTLSEFFEQEVWKKIGAEEKALWTISEKDKRERAYCCFYSNARDFARLGQLYLDSGKWHGVALINTDFFEESIQAVNIPDSEGKIINYYGLHWWLGKHKGHGFYYARGILGQYIVIIPDLDMVLVRLGNKRDPTRNVEIPSDLYTYLNIAFELSN